jgi:hypothetical protein
MSNETIPRQHVELSFRELNDAGRHTLAGSIAQLAPSSPLYAANPSIQTSVAALAKKDTTLAQSNTTVENDKKKLVTDTAAETVARTAFDAELNSLVGLTENTATSAADIASMALKPQVRALIQKGPPPVPDGIDTKYPKKGHGEATVTVQAPKGARWQFTVQSSPNPPTATSWGLLVGTGRTRTLTGASGTQEWVRAARVRGQLQSDWCTPVLVTIP